VKEVRYANISSKLAVNDNCMNGQVTSFADLAIYYSVAIFSQTNYTSPGIKYRSGNRPAVGPAVHVKSYNKD